MAGDIKLEQYYAGDDVWFDFVGKVQEELHSPAFGKGESILNILKEKLNFYEDIASVFYFIYREDSVKYLEKRALILDNLTPIECVATEELVHRLREALLRYPY